MSDWKPEPGTYWLDSDDDVWCVDRYGTLWLLNNPYHDSADVLDEYGPLRRLEPTDEVVGNE